MPGRTASPAPVPASLPLAPASPTPGPEGPLLPPDRRPSARRPVVASASTRSLGSFTFANHDPTRSGAAQPLPGAPQSVLLLVVHRFPLAVRHRLDVTGDLGLAY